MASSVKIHLCFSSKCARDVTSGCYICGKTSRARDRRRILLKNLAELFMYIFTIQDRFSGFQNLCEQKEVSLAFSVMT